MPNAQLATMVADLVKFYNEHASLRTSQHDAAAKPILEALVKLGEIPNPDDCFVEWQGVYEFGIVPVFYGMGDRCLNVNADGSIDQF